MRGLVTSGQPWRGVDVHPALGSTNSRLRELVPALARPTGPMPPGRAPDAVAASWS